MANRVLLTLTILAFSTVYPLKLENFLQNDEPVIDPEVKESLSNREPRFLLRSTATTTVTTTLSSATACYATAGITAVCARRKKRSVKTIEQAPIQHEQTDGETPPAIFPSKISTSLTGDLTSEVEPSALPLSPRREPRFLQFFVTTTYSTVTSTATTFTTTTTFSLTNCIPTSFAYSACA